MNLELIIVSLAAIAVVGLVGLSLTVGDAPVARRRPNHAHRPGPFEGALDVIDRSIGMYLVRRLTGRPTTRPSDHIGPTTPLTSDEVAYRIGVADAPLPPPRNVPAAPAPAGSAERAASARAAAGATATAKAARTSAARRPVPVAVVPPADRSPLAPPVAPPAPAAPRVRLVRDAGIALMGLAALGLVGILVWPKGPGGPPTGSHFAVVRASVTPRASAAAQTQATPILEPPASLDVLTPAPTPEPTPVPLVAATPRPTPKPTPRPTPKPTAAPTPKPTAAPTPKPTATPALQASITSTVCSGSTVQFTALTMSGAVYTWVFGGDGNASGRIVSHDFTASGTYTVILSVDRSGDTQGDSVVVNVPC